MKKHSTPRILDYDYIVKNNHSTRRILDYNYGLHVTISYNDDPADPNQYKIHLITYDPASMTYRKELLNKYADLPSALHYVTQYITAE